MRLRVGTVVVVVLASAASTAAAGAAAETQQAPPPPPPPSLPYRRPPPEKRLFRSAAVDTYLDAVFPRFKDRDLATLFVNCLPNTLDTTVQAHNDTDTFVITGDIEAMWLRDSAFQLLPYLNFTREDPALASLTCNLARRHAYSLVHVTPYANAFNFNASGAGYQADETTPPMGPAVWEMKYELDSLAAFLRLSRSYFQATGDAACFHYVPAFASQGEESPLWLRAAERVLEVVQTQQAGTLEELGAEGNGPAYKFKRETQVATDTLMMAGVGPMARRCGLSKGYFRPSDDAVTFSYHVPSQAMMVVELRHLAAVLPQIFPPTSNNFTGTISNASKQTQESLASSSSNTNNKQSPLSSSSAPSSSSSSSTSHHMRAQALATRATMIAEEMDAAIRREALVPVPVAARDLQGQGGNDTLMFAYETDGFGSFLLMDDANVPSLLALPYLSFTHRGDPLYEATRRFILSEDNPFFFRGAAASGVGGPHIGPPYIWPMALIVQALTSDDDAEIEGLLKTIVASSAGTGFIHESFHANDVGDFTRAWFALGNGMLGELVMKVLAERPSLLLHDIV